MLVANVSVIEAFISNIFLATFTFIIVKITMQGQQLIRSIADNYFSFSVYKNYKAKVIAAGILIANVLN